MSWDIEIEHAPCVTCSHTSEGDHINLTYNLSPMLWAADSEFSWSLYHGESARLVGIVLLNLLNKMDETPDKWRKMNPVNGWGTYDDCLQGRLREWALTASKSPLTSTVSIT